MNSKNKYLFFLFLIVILTVLVIDRSRNKASKSEELKTVQTSPSESIAQFQQQFEQLNHSKNIEPTGEETKRLLKKLNLVALQISQLGEPDHWQRRLKEIANDLTKNDLMFYLNFAANIKNSGDERLAAISLIKESHAHDLFLAAFITNPVPFLQDTHRQEQEFAFRAFAIEGLQTIAIIQNIQNKIDSPFLVDRLMRQKAFILHQSAAPEIQDQNALKKLIGQ